MDDLISLYHTTHSQIPSHTTLNTNAILSHHNLHLQQLPIDKHSLTIPKHPSLSTTLSPRKTHEISQLTPYITTIIIENDVEFVIDVGCGAGYLSRAVVQRNDVKVIGVERRNDRRTVARRMDRIVERQNDTIYVEELNDIENENVVRFVRSRQSRNGVRPRALVIGLDVCGDFMTEVLKLVTQESKSLDLVGCCIVSCCFQKVTELFTVEDRLVLEGLKLSSEQDLRGLTEDEVINLYVSQGDGTPFEQWLYRNGVLSQILECIVHNDRVMYLSPTHSASLDVVFDFHISTRNVALKAIKKDYVKAE